MTSMGDEDRMAASGSMTRKQWIAAGVFALAALYLAAVVPTVEIAWVSAILLFTIYLFAFEVVGVDPPVYALTVAIATSNSFLIPTHQVNALIMGPGGYRVPDFMKAGGVMTVLFLVVMIVMMNLVF